MIKSLFEVSTVSSSMVSVKLKSFSASDQCHDTYHGTYGGIEHLQALKILLTELEQQSEIHTLLLTGRPFWTSLTKSFTKSIQDPAISQILSQLGQEITLLLENSKKTTVACLYHPIQGAACEIALSCDLILCHKDTTWLWESNTQEGFLGLGSIMRLVKHWGLAIARSFLWSPQPLSSTQLHNYAIITAILQGNSEPEFDNTVTLWLQQHHHQLTFHTKTFKSLLQSFFQRDVYAYNDTELRLSIDIGHQLAQTPFVPASPSLKEASWNL